MAIKTGRYNRTLCERCIMNKIETEYHFLLVCPLSADIHVENVHLITGLVYINSSLEWLCKHVVAKVTLVPRSVNLTSKRDKVGHGEGTINIAMIISVCDCL